MASVRTKSISSLAYANPDTSAISAKMTSMSATAFLALTGVPVANLSIFTTAPVPRGILAPSA